MYSRTYDAQRFSPLKQITTQNVGQLREVFKKELAAGVQESIPIVYRGVMYLLLPGNGVQALDATTGALIWEHKRPARRRARQDDRDLRGHGLQQHARRLHRGARRANRRGALGDEVVGRLTAGHDGHRGQGDHRPRLRTAPRGLLHRRARREDRQGSVALLYGRRLERARRRHLGRRARRDARGVHLGTARRLRSGPGV